MAWQTPKTNWGQPGQTVPIADDFNRIEGNILHLQDTKETPAGAQAKANTAEANAKAYTDAHEQKAAPHSGHETPAGAQAKADAAAGAVQAELNMHEADNVQQTNEGQIATPHGLPKCNFNSNTIPTQNDDVTKNYTNGSFWINENSKEVFICTNNSSGAAIWIKVNYSLIEYIYTEGFENKAFVVGDIYDYNGTKDGYVEYSKETDHLYIYAKGGYDTTLGSTAFVTYETQNPIDFSDISLLNFDMSIDEAGGDAGNKEVYVGLIDVAHSGDYDDLTAYMKFTDIKNRGVVTIDTTNLNGSYYVKITCMARFNRTINAKIYNIWGE